VILGSSLITWRWRWRVRDRQSHAKLVRRLAGVHGCETIYGPLRKESVEAFAASSKALAERQ
jgi:hypothetical protein